MKRLFIETDIFTKLLAQEKNKDLERIIKDELLKDLEKGDLIKGTGGFRKIRVANKESRKGKSGSYRVIYLDIATKEKTFLFLLYSKSEVESLTSAQKAKLKQCAEELKNE